jgi:two-component system response regulator
MKKIILLVEDNESDEKLTVRALKKSGVDHDVIVQRDGAEALDWLFATGAFAGRVPASPAVVLLELNLPNIDGIGVLHRLRADERTKLLPVVVLTSSAQTIDIERALAAGASAYVRKPVAYADFADVALTVARFWLTMNEGARVVGGSRP